MAQIWHFIKYFAMEPILTKNPEWYTSNMCHTVQKDGADIDALKFNEFWILSFFKI